MGRRPTVRARARGPVSRSNSIRPKRLAKRGRNNCGRVSIRLHHLRNDISDLITSLAAQFGGDGRHHHRGFTLPVRRVVGRGRHRGRSGRDRRDGQRHPIRDHGQQTVPGACHTVRQSRGSGERQPRPRTRSTASTPKTSTRRGAGRTEPAPGPTPNSTTRHPAAKRRRFRGQTQTAGDFVTSEGGEPQAIRQYWTTRGIATLAARRVPDRNQLPKAKETSLRGWKRQRPGQGEHRVHPMNDQRGARGNTRPISATDLIGRR